MNLKNIPIVGEFLRSQNARSLLETAVLLLAAAFVAYNPAFPNEQKWGFLIPLLAGAFACATGVKGALLAYAKSKPDLLPEIINTGINDLEALFGKNIVNDDFQRWLVLSLKSEILNAKPDARAQARLEELIDQFESAFRQINAILKS